MGRLFGADPGQVFIAGHSAGAAHVSTYLFFRRFHVSRGDGLGGAVLISCPTFDTSSLDPTMDRVYYGRDESLYPARSIMNRLDVCRIPLYIVYAELDPPRLRRQSAGLFAQLCRNDCPGSVHIRTLTDHNHLSEILQINTPRDSLGPDLLSYFRSLLNRAR